MSDYISDSTSIIRTRGITTVQKRNSLFLVWAGYYMLIIGYDDDCIETVRYDNAAQRNAMFDRLDTLLRERV